MSETATKNDQPASSEPHCSTVLRGTTEELSAALEETYRKLCRNDPAVSMGQTCIDRGADQVETLKRVIVCLVDHKQSLLAKVNYLDSIAPRLIAVGGGKLMRLDVPDSFIRVDP